MKPVFVSGPLNLLIENLAKLSKPVTLFFMGSRTEFLAELPPDWYSNLPETMTEVFTDSVELVFSNSVPDLVARLYSDKSAKEDTKIIWGLVSYVRNSARYYGSATNNVHKMSNILYMVTDCVLGNEKYFIFGDSLEVVGHSELTLDLLPVPVAPAASSPIVRRGKKSGSLLDTEPGVSGTPIRGSTENPLTVEEVLEKWFTVKRSA